MEVDKYFKSSVQWLDVILKAVEERDKRHKWHDTSSALYKLYPKADDVCQVMKASAEQLNTILTSSSSDEAVDPNSVENIRLNCRMSVQLLVPLIAHFILFFSMSSFNPVKSSLASKVSIVSRTSFASCSLPFADCSSAKASIR